MKLIEIGKDIYACLQDDRGFGWSNSGFINRGGGLVVDSFWDLKHTKKMMDLYREKGPQPPKYLVNTHHNGDHTWGNQLFKGSEIIAHRHCVEAMKKDIGPQILKAMIDSDNISDELKWFVNDIRGFDFSGIQITLPDRIIDDNLELDLGGLPCRIIYVGPAHTAGDVIVYLPEDGIIFGGDVLWNSCTPIGWEGTYAKWLHAIDFVISLNPKVIVPGHGNLCGIKETLEVKEYFNHIYNESERFYKAGLSVLEASKQIDLGPYAKWTEPQRLAFNVSRAYSEFDGKPWDAPVDGMALLLMGHALSQYWEKKI